jgi:hypothetical protein
MLLKFFKTNKEDFTHRKLTLKSQILTIWGITWRYVNSQNTSIPSKDIITIDEIKLIFGTVVMK